jgi:hypothetical protein
MCAILINQTNGGSNSFEEFLLIRGIALLRPERIKRYACATQLSIKRGKTTTKKELAIGFVYR